MIIFGDSKEMFDTVPYYSLDSILVQINLNIKIILINDSFRMMVNNDYVLERMMLLSTPRQNSLYYTKLLKTDNDKHFHRLCDFIFELDKHRIYPDLCSLDYLFIHFDSHQVIYFIEKFDLRWNHRIVDHILYLSEERNNNNTIILKYLIENYTNNVSIMSDVFSCCCVIGDLNLIKYLDERISYDVLEPIIQCRIEEVDDLDVIDYLIKNHSFEGIESYFLHQSCCSENLHIVKHMIENHGLGIDYILCTDYQNDWHICLPLTGLDGRYLSYSSVIDLCILTNSVKVLDYLIGHFKLNPTDVLFNYDDSNLSFVCSKGWLEMTQLLIDSFGLTFYDIKKKHIDCFENACSQGHLDIVKYLIDNLDLTFDRIKSLQCDESIFRPNFSSGHCINLDVIKYLIPFYFQDGIEFGSFCNIIDGLSHLSCVEPTVMPAVKTKVKSTVKTTVMPTAKTKVLPTVMPTVKTKVLPTVKTKVMPKKEVDKELTSLISQLAKVIIC